MYSKLNPEITKPCPFCNESTMYKVDMYDENTKIKDSPHELTMYVCVKCGFVARFYSDVAVKEWH
jgi:predicted RNA-binding Zn-ribbon protein involved in translation (DUF1610 family)